MRLVSDECSDHLEHHPASPTRAEAEGSTPFRLPHRKRMRRRESSNSPRYLTFSCYQRLQLFGSPELRRVFVEAVRRAHEKEHFDLIAWVIMPEHIHPMVRPGPDVRVLEDEGANDRGVGNTGLLEWGPITAGLKTSVAKRILNRWRRLHAPILSRLRNAGGELHFWQPGGGFDRNVRNDGELEREIRYIHRNPVERELVQKPTDWDWSSARFWAARHEGRDPDPDDLWCDWPPGDSRAWAMWSGFQ